MSQRFPILGIDSDKGSEFINHHLLHWCEHREITLTRSRPGNSNDAARRRAQGEQGRGDNETRVVGRGGA